jgi:ferritin-like metal-binding protein YciE
MNVHALPQQVDLDGATSTADALLANISSVVRGQDRQIRLVLTRRFAGPRRGTRHEAVTTETKGWTMGLHSLQDVLTEQLADLYSAEKQLVGALPKLQQAAADEGLRTAFGHHLDETRTHVTRLEEIFERFAEPVPNETCEGMKGLIAEGEKVIAMPGEGPAKDAALIAAAQRVEHYEIAAYGTARTLADQLNLDDEKRLLDETLDEEATADKTLTRIATGGLFGSGVNEEARTTA